MTINNYKIFLASPSDTNEERNIAEEVVKELNQTIGTRHNFNLKLLKWENDSYPGFGEDGQDVINKNLGDDYDVFIGIMWKKFGTPTKRAGSGTKEEFNRAYKRYKNKENLNIMFYFNNDRLPQDIDYDQFSKVKEFKKEIADLGGLYWSYEGSKNFEKTLRQHLTNCILDIVNKSNENAKESNSETLDILTLNQKFQDYIYDLEVVFAHSSGVDINLNHIYVSPDVKNLKQKKGNSFHTINLDNISNAIDIDGFKYAIIGGDTSGKTANLKHLFNKYFQMGLTPILITGNDITNNIRVDSLRKLLEEKSKNQYSRKISLEENLNKEIVIIIDDFHKATKGKNKFWTTLVKNLESITNNIIISGNTMMPLENLSGGDPFVNFELYSLLEFGPKLRYELTQIWYSIGTNSKYIDPNDFRRKIDFAQNHIKTIIGKGYVPPYPFYLLSILQSIDSGNSINQNYSVHGFYYEHLINECFNKAVDDKKEISLFYNYMTHLCYHIFEQETSEVTLEQFKDFHKLYCSKYDLTYSQNKILETLEKAKLIDVNNVVHIKEKYIYYFFIAKFIANNISKKETKKLISKMALRLFKDEYSSIIMFITHLSKDEFIIQEIINIGNSIFPDTKECLLEDDIQTINSLIENIPEQVLELIDVDKNRKDSIEEEEKNEKIENEIENDSQNYSEFGLDDDISDIDVYAKITRALKTIDILGQISKKYWGELDGEKKLEIVTTTYSLGLRALGFYLNLLQKNKDSIIEHVKGLIKKDNYFKSDYSLIQNIEETARDYIFRMSFLSSFALIKRVSQSVGYDKLKNSFNKALENNPHNSVKLIDLAIKLGYSSIKSELSNINSCEEDMNDNKLSFMVLRNLAMDHLQMFDTDYKTRSKLCEILKISEKEQLVISSSSKVKKKKLISSKR